MSAQSESHQLVSMHKISNDSLASVLCYHVFQLICWSSHLSSEKNIFVSIECLFLFILRFLLVDFFSQLCFHQLQQFTFGITLDTPGVWSHRLHLKASTVQFKSIIIIMIFHTFREKFSWTQVGVLMWGLQYFDRCTNGSMFFPSSTVTERLRWRTQAADIRPLH